MRDDHAIGVSDQRSPAVRRTASTLRNGDVCWLTFLADFLTVHAVSVGIRIRAAFEIIIRAVSRRLARADGSACEWITSVPRRLPVGAMR